MTNNNEINETDETNEIQTFFYDKRGLRTVWINGELWWVLKDVCELLGLSNPTAVADRLDADERSKSNLGRQGEAIIINESGLYKVILRSDKPEAKKFMNWLTREVLPSIRKHGGYLTKEKAEEFMNDPDAWITFFTALKEEKAKNRHLQAEKERLLIINESLQEQIEKDRPKVLLANTIAYSDDTVVTVGELAKILKTNGVETGQNRLFEQLRKDGFIIKRSLTGRNVPTQESVRRGLFTFNKIVNIQDNGTVMISYAPKVTAKGQEYFINYFLEEQKKEKPLTSDSAQGALNFYININTNDGKDNGNNSNRQ
jgi:anti-repressor protein